MESGQQNWLVIGLGNPGRQYEKTRHNIGFMVVKKVAERLGCHWHEERRWPGQVAKVSRDEVVWHLLMPTTYMNLSGQAVKGYLDYFRIPLTHLLVVVDDVALDFGCMRLKEKGSPGGHNGLKSVEAHLGSQLYKRLRMGIGDRTHGELVDYVLAAFLPDEQERLPAFLERGVEVVLEWPHKRFDRLMTAVNSKSKQESNGKTPILPLPQKIDSQENKHESRE